MTGATALPLRRPLLRFIDALENPHVAGLYLITSVCGLIDATFILAVAMRLQTALLLALLVFTLALPALTRQKTVPARA